MKYLLLICLFILGCGGPFTMTVSSMSLDDVYKHELSMNPEKKCTPHLLQAVWDEIKDSYYSDKQPFIKARVILRDEPVILDGPEKMWTWIYQVAHRQYGMDTSVICNEFINALVLSMGKYNEYVSPDRSHERFMRLTSQIYGGIGFLFTVDYNNKRIYVDDIFPGSPAEKGGLLRFDEILKIDGRAVKDLDMKNASAFFRGGSSKTIQLAIRRAHSFQNLLFTRGYDKYQDAYCRIMNGVPYCRVYGFGGRTASNFEKSFKALPKHSKKIIIDLRNNPGGNVFTATEMLGKLFLKKRISTVLVRKKYGMQPFSDNYPTALLEGYKTVVLSNGGTVSSAELFIAALKDYKLATLIGEKSFGKGVIQKTTIHYGAILSIVHGYFLSPFGNIIDGIGVEPDIKVLFTLEDLNNSRDPQLQRAFEVLK